MLIREYTERDLDALRAIHAAQSFDYRFPDLSNPLFVTKLVLCSDEAAEVPVAQSGSPAAFSVGSHFSGSQQRLNDTEGPPKRNERSAETASKSSSRILCAAFLRLTAEAYLLLDPRVGTPRERWQWLLALHEAARRDAWLRGLEDVHAWLPPPIAQKFGRRLERLGWRRDDSWTPYCTRLEGM